MNRNWGTQGVFRRPVDRHMYTTAVPCWKIKAAIVGITSLQASTEVPGHEKCSSATVQQEAASLACMLGAVYTSQRLRVLSAAIVQQHKDAARALESHPSWRAIPVCNVPCRQAGGQEIFSSPLNLSKAASAVPNSINAETAETQQSKARLPVSVALAEAWQSDAQRSSSAVHVGDNSPSLSEKASAVLTALDPAAIRSQREDVQQPVYESAANIRQSYVQQSNSTLPAGDSGSVSLSYPMAQHVALPACRKEEERTADYTLSILRNTDCKMEAALQNIEEALQHFQAMIEKDPQLVGQVGNETCAASQVLRAKRHELMEFMEALEEYMHGKKTANGAAAPLGANLYAVTTAAASCVAEFDAFLQVAEFTIKEARSRVLYSSSQPWPSQRSRES